jgi:hypothetical protein
MGLRETLQEPSPTSIDALARAGEAMMRGSWEEARELYEASLAEAETPEALEGLGITASWLDDAETSDNVRAGLPPLPRAWRPSRGGEGLIGIFEKNGMRFLEEDGH